MYSPQIDLQNLTVEDLQEEYGKLLELYHNSKQCQDNDRQEIHELKRNLGISKAAEQHLNHEIEIITTTQSIEISKVQTKYQQDIDEIRKKYADLEESNSHLEQNVEELKNKLETDKVKIDHLELQQQNQSKRISIAKESDKELILERENIELLRKLNDFQDELDKANRLTQEKERKIELLNEQLECVEENLLSKRAELDEKTALLESTQEHMVELNSELALLRTAPNNINRKGNSLFAEVDDQRQVMRQKLANQKKNYLQMKKVYNESEHEIRRLKRENAAMHSEIEQCVSIYLNAEKTYKEKLNKRILQLLQQNEDLEKKLHNTEDQLVNIAYENGVNWLDSMLTFCKNETRDLKTELNSLLLEKSALDYNLRDTQQKLSKWRFEALKSRCTLIHRESLLDENGIKYEKIQPCEININSNEFKNAEPRIFNSNKKNELNNLNESTNGDKILELVKIDDSHITESHEDYLHISLDSSLVQSSSGIRMIPNNISFENDKSLKDELSELSSNNLKTEFQNYKDTHDIKFNIIKNNHSTTEEPTEPAKQSLINKIKLENETPKNTTLKRKPYEDIANINIKVKNEFKIDDSDITESLEDYSHILLDSSLVQNSSRIRMIPNNISFASDKSLKDELSELSSNNSRTKFGNYKDSHDTKFNIVKNNHSITEEPTDPAKQSLINKIKLQNETPKNTTLKRKPYEDIANIDIKKSNLKTKKDLFLDEEIKSVTFQENIKNSTMVKSENNKSIKNRSNSSIVMRKIVITSNTDKKRK